MTIDSTNRLIIREAVVKDASFFIDLMNSEGWLAYIGDRNIRTIESAKSYIKKSLIASYRSNGFGLYVVIEKESMEPIGISGLVKRSTLNSPDLGFALLPWAEGKGFAFEACLAVLEKVRDGSVQEEILAITSPKNTRSKKLLERLGFAQIEHKPDNSEVEKLDLYQLIIIP